MESVRGKSRTDYADSLGAVPPEQQLREIVHLPVHFANLLVPGGGKFRGAALLEHAVTQSDATAATQRRETWRCRLRQWRLGARRLLVEPFGVAGALAPLVFAP